MSTGTQKSAKRTGRERAATLCNLQKTHKAALFPQSPESADDQSLPSSPEQAVLRNQYVEPVIAVQLAPGRADFLETGRRLADLRTRLISTGQLFERDRGTDKAPNIVALGGVEGIGKTTEVQKLAFDWVNGKGLEKFAFVFLFKFWELNILQKEAVSLVGLIAWQHKHLKGKDLGEILQRPESLLFIFDGLDQYKHSLDFPRAQLCSNVEEAAPVHKLVSSLLAQALLNGCSVLITSRTTSSSLFELLDTGKVDLYAEIYGFAPEQRKRFFGKLFGGSRVADEAFRYVEQNDGLYSLCFSPSFCSIFASVLKSCSAARERELETVSEMLVNFVWGNMLPAPGKAREKRGALLKLGKLAFHGVSEGLSVFYDEDLCSFGLTFPKRFLPGIFQRESLQGRWSYTFAVPPLQQFLAACYLLFDTSADLKEFLKKTDSQSDVHFQILMLFLAGISEPAVMKPVDAMLVEFGRGRAETVQEWLKGTAQQALQDHRKKKLLTALRFLYETQNKSLITTEFAKEICRSLSYNTFSDLDCTVLLSVSSCCQDLPEFRLMGSSFTETGFDRLLPAFRSCQKIDLKNCRLTPGSCEVLASALSSQQSRLTALDLNSNPLEDSGIKLLCTGMKDSNCKIQNLVLRGCSFTADCCEDLAAALSTDHSSLAELDLSFNQLGDSGLKRLSAGLRDPNCKLETLGLSSCELTAGGCEDLASALCCSHSCLHSLYLSANELEDSGLKWLSAAMRDPNCKLQDLELSDCYLTSECCQGLASALQAKHSLLRRLQLGNNELGSAGGRVLCAALQEPGCKVESLGLSHCDLTSELCQDIASVLCSGHCSLRELELAVNKLGDSGVKVLCAALRNPNCKLERLNLDLTSLTDTCVGDLSSALTTSRTLSVLDLSNNGFTDASVPAFRQMIAASTLKEILLSEADFSEESLDVLLELDTPGRHISL
ncbi:NACHT, LRR and PYD domains-containing protein 12-like [Polyodon spathula]|uniref:NACHT, LRR and PYD domains-containing protein 12-like n=1 Tax=Polyodon spathula TaxID=7913 RepID=UPI001B7DBE64|nr:NACHT, LRR and PYD domains-containing protein 12-like [Polyodon spathula]XP_041097431.1 NACHT, LRR and PYD domains-containing protein 12-like [Polyodon spathula]